MKWFESYSWNQSGKLLNSKINLGRQMRNSFFLVLLLVILLNVTITVSALSVTIHVPEKYTSVQAGEKFYFDIDVSYPENPQRKDLRLKYNVLNLEGDVVAQAKVLKAVETQASFVDSITIPDGLKKGMYILRVGIQDYESLSEEVEVSFYITSGFKQIQLYSLVLLSVLTLMGMSTIIIMLRIKRKR